MATSFLTSFSLATEPHPSLPFAAPRTAIGRGTAHKRSIAIATGTSDDYALSLAPHPANRSSPSRTPTCAHPPVISAAVMFRKRGGASQDGTQQVDELLKQDAPLDEGEQERVVQEFEEMQLQNTRLWRRTFGAGGRGDRSMRAPRWQLGASGAAAPITPHRSLARLSSPRHRPPGAPCA